MRMLRSPTMMKMMTALKAKGDTGLSNAEIDALLEASSQWWVFWNLRELLALEVVEFDVQFFGEPAKYKLTKLGLSVLEELTQVSV